MNFSFQIIIIIIIIIITKMEYDENFLKSLGIHRSIPESTNPGYSRQNG